MELTLGHHVEIFGWLIFFVHDLFARKLLPSVHLNLADHFIFILALEIGQLQQKVHVRIGAFLF